MDPVELVLGVIALASVAAVCRRAAAHCRRAPASRGLLILGAIAAPDEIVEAPTQEDS